jgi:hypothetical protein
MHVRFVFPWYGSALCLEPPSRVPPRNDIHTFSLDRDLPEFLLAGLRIGNDVDPSIDAQIRAIIQERWDCFYKDSVRQHPILGFETSSASTPAPPIQPAVPNPTTARTPTGPHASNIIMDQIASLLHNDWIDECGGPWGSLIVLLAPKPHQEHITDIKDFVWHMCISYQKLNAVTLAFEYPIPRCDDAIDDFGDGFGRLWFIGLDTRQGYHQIRVRLIDHDKLAFFGPDGKKYTFKVMPIGPKNAPACYTAMMRIMQDEWDALFFDSLYPEGCRVIINDILLFSSDLPTLLNYLDCVCQIFIKYQVSLSKLPKCDFLKRRFEYVGHDITADGNCPLPARRIQLQEPHLRLAATVQRSRPPFVHQSL